VRWNRDLCTCVRFPSHKWAVIKGLGRSGTLGGAGQPSSSVEVNVANCIRTNCQGGEKSPVGTTAPRTEVFKMNCSGLAQLRSSIKRILAGGVPRGYVEGDGTDLRQDQHKSSLDKRRFTYRSSVRPRTHIPRDTEVYPGRAKDAGRAGKSVPGEKIPVNNCT